MPEHLQPYADLWAAAIRLLVEDAYRGAHRGHQAGEDAVQALDDVLSCGPILRRLCAPLCIDAELVSRGVRVELGLRKAA